MTSQAQDHDVVTPKAAIRMALAHDGHTDFIDVRKDTLESLLTDHDRLEAEATSLTAKAERLERENKIMRDALHEIATTNASVAMLSTLYGIARAALREVEGK